MNEFISVQMTMDIKFKQLYSRKHEGNDLVNVRSTCIYLLTPQTVPKPLIYGRWCDALAD